MIDQTSAIAIHLVELAQVEEWNPAKLGLQLLTIVQWAREVCIGKPFFTRMVKSVETMLNHTSCTTLELKESVEFLNENSDQHVLISTLLSFAVARDF